jgi:hypothetical protein
MQTKTKSVLVTLALVISAFAPARAATEWEIEPQVDPRIAIGKISIVGGELAVEPILFVLKNINVSMPVEVTLVATDANQPVDLSVYKETPDKAFLSGSAKFDEPLKYRFRTADQVYFAVRGADGAHYQLVTWVSPEMQEQPDSPFLPVSDYPATPPRVEKPQQPAANTTSSTRTGAALVLGVWPSILLGLILLALIAIIVLLWRRGSKSSSALLLLSIALLPTLVAQQSPVKITPKDTPEPEKKTLQDLYSQIPKPEKGVPGKITPKDEAPKTGMTVQDLKSWIDKIKDKANQPPPEDQPGIVKPTKWEPTPEIVTDPYTGKSYTRRGWKQVEDKPGTLRGKTVQVVNNAGTVMTIMLLGGEEYGFLDPREAAIQKNMNPPGMPLLPSRCAKSPECGDCFRKANKDLMEARSLLEEQYVIYKQAEAHAGRIIELGDAAAGLSPYAKLLWDYEKHGPNIAKLQQEFYGKYDANLEKLLHNLNEALVEQGACERNAFGDQDWYNRYGWLYYNFMRDRYTRK